MLLSAVSILVVAQSSSEIPEELMNNPVFVSDDIAHREDGSKGNELGHLEVGVFALLKLEVSLPQSEGLLNTTEAT